MTIAFPLSRVFQERGSTPGPIAAFTKHGYRPALKPRFAQVRLHLINAASFFFFFQYVWSYV